MRLLSLLLLLLGQSLVPFLFTGRGYEIGVLLFMMAVVIAVNVGRSRAVEKNREGNVDSRCRTEKDG